MELQYNQVKQILNTTPSGIAVIEVDDNNTCENFHTTYYNDSFFSFSGYTREEYDAILKENELSFVFEEDRKILTADTLRVCRGEIGESVSSVVRCHTKDGGYRWLLLTAQLSERRNDICIVIIAMMDITAMKETEDKLRISEEMLRIAADNDKRLLVTYDVKSNTCQIESHTLYSAKYGEVLDDIPNSLINLGIVSLESAAELHKLFSRIKQGKKSTCVSLSLRTGEDEYQWFECNASTVLDADDSPDRAVLVFHNITEQRIKEAVYKKWQNSIRSRSPESYTLFRCNLNKDASFDEQEGELLKIKYTSKSGTFNHRTKEYAKQYVFHEDRDAYTSLLNSDTLIAMYFRGEHSATLEYREMGENGELTWRLLTVELVEYLNSTDIQAFLMYEDIDEKKKAELMEIERAKTDPLTGVLNRVAFAEKVDYYITHESGVQHAMLMIDMDGFKQINDTFGHAAGDQSLMDTANIIRAMVREKDVICRLGGDEFLIWLCGIPYDAVIEKIAKQLCEQVRKVYSPEITLSGSVGIAVYPRDGHDFDELYRNADAALYKVKQSGGNDYTFYNMAEINRTDDGTETTITNYRRIAPAYIDKRRMLIVDDNSASRSLLIKTFRDEYIIETAKNGTEAMVRLRHFGTAISVVLLDLIMPAMDGYEVLRKIQSNVDLRTIPVVVVSGDDDRAALLKTIESGAADFVTKPVDTDLIRLRVKSAISKSENERLRAQNSYLQLQRDEEVKFHTVLESTGTVVVEYNWHNHVCVYANDIEKYIAGTYNHRSLWQVFLSDMVASSEDVKSLQDNMMWLANDRTEKSYTKLVMLKTPYDQMHWFRMNIYKQIDAYGLAEKMIITFNDVHEEVLANEKLRYQATRDELTGLYNRAGFIDRAAIMIAARAPGYFTMSCIDIEKFKVINDQYGTEKGDEVLRGFANELKKLNRGIEVLCCRVMADHFAVLYPSELLGTEELIRNHMASERLDGSLPPLKIYVGRCQIDDKSLSVTAIYDRAAMAKETVKGRYDVYVATYDESMRTTILRQQRITGQMKNALLEEQFEVWLQPQFNHRTGTLSGAEALVRWRHPEEGLVAPAEFIPIFERNGFIYEMDKYVWEQTCRMLRKWLDEGWSSVSVSVNISRYDVFRNDCVDVIKGLVKKYRLPHNLLRLEITESAFSESADQIIQVVEELVDAGFIVEIDDFGSGYSSLNTLKDVPAQILKLDMRFLENAKNGKRGSSIIESVVHMAVGLGMSVIAEGVETIEQADYLKSIGCELIQGYLYSKPVPVSEYEERYRIA